jgi:hypothetical protein
MIEVQVGHDEMRDLIRIETRRGELSASRTRAVGAKIRP